MEAEATHGDVTRVRPTETGTEPKMLTQQLSFLRATVVMKATGVGDDEAAGQPIPASELTLASVVKHLTGTAVLVQHRFRRSRCAMAVDR